MTIIKSVIYTILNIYLTHKKFKKGKQMKVLKFKETKVEEIEYEDLTKDPEYNKYVGDMDLIEKSKEILELSKKYWDEEVKNPKSIWYSRKAFKREYLKLYPKTKNTALDILFLIRESILNGGGNKKFKRICCYTNNFFSTKLSKTECNINYIFSSLKDKINIGSILLDVQVLPIESSNKFIKYKKIIIPSTMVKAIENNEITNLKKYAKNTWIVKM